jgi:hypothetical protein
MPGLPAMEYASDAVEQQERLAASFFGWDVNLGGEKHRSEFFGIAIQARCAISESGNSLACASRP